MSDPKAALIQPVDREYRKHGGVRKEHIEFKDDGIAYALRAGILEYVIYEKQDRVDSV